MPSMNPVEMGERIKKQRLLNGYSREKLAEMADITPRYCYDIELGLKNMSLNTLYKISDSLNISTDYILFGAQNEADEYLAVISIVRSCPADRLKHLEQIVSHYVQAVRNINATLSEND
ncbi:MAG: helix-turn-helix transcriptional regulator [Schaedlerella sp.]|nr:helix-turn-helix domain-containing protein [Lachnospiraceae bacterium]MDY4202568.1 helix-turn-helix transcriptional regulator [Schaedlerella sp.]